MIAAGVVMVLAMVAIVAGIAMKVSEPPEAGPVEYHVNTITLEDEKIFIVEVEVASASSGEKFTLTFEGKPVNVQYCNADQSSPFKLRFTFFSPFMPSSYLEPERHLGGGLRLTSDQHDMIGVIDPLL